MLDKVLPMTVHARCEAAIRNAPVDRVPRYLPGIACEVSSKILGRPVHTGTGSLHFAESCAWIKGESAHKEFEHKLLEDLAEVLRVLRVDVFRMPWRAMNRPTKQLDEYTMLYGDPDKAWHVSRYDPDSGEYGVAKASAPEHDAEESLRQEVEAGEADLESGGLDRVRIPPHICDLWKRYGAEFYVVCNGGGIVVGAEAESLMLVVTHADLIRRRLMISARKAARLGELLVEAGMPPVLIGGGDLAGKDGPIYSPRSFRQVMLPALSHAMSRLNAMGAHYCFRSDGNLWPVADMMFEEARVPGYGEVDREAGMTIGALRERYPKLVVWGNMSVSRLAGESESWAREESARIIAESGGTGYFHGPSNAVMRDVPPENVVAMFEAA